MKALIFSDSHKNTACMEKIIGENKDIDLIIHAGDVVEDALFLEKYYKDINIVYVKGNNDYRFFDVPSERVFDFGGKRIFLTHGHSFGVKMNPLVLLPAAKERGANICIFGHTHSRFLKYAGGIYLFNPGSARSSAGLLEVSENEIKLLFLY